jgi:H+/gluconate symporter-like permease
MGYELISLIGILVALALIMWLAYKGMNLLIVGPLCSLLALLFAYGHIDVTKGMLTTYSAGFGNYAKNYFLMFALGAMFGRLTSDTGTGKTIALKLATMLGRIHVKTQAARTSLTVMLIALITTVLCLGGVSSFVVIFTMVGIMKPLFEAQDIPWHTSLLGITIGSQVFTSTMIPGSPAIQNLIPIKYLGTTAKAAPMLALASAAVSAIFCIIYVYYVARKAEKEQERFLPTGMVIARDFKGDIDIKEGERITWGQFYKALSPSIILLIALNAFNMAPEVALLIGIIANIILYYDKIQDMGKSLGEGAMSGGRTLLGVCAVVGFGSVVAIVPGYTFVVKMLDSIPGSPIVQLVIATNLIAGITGSASGGLAIALETFAKRYLEMGIAPDVIHRVSAMACYGLDSLPHNGSVINMINTAGLTHANSYKHFFWCTVVIPVFVSVFSIVFVQMGII